MLLQTERLQLRRLTLDDAELMLSIWNDPTFIRYVGDRGIRTIDDARQAIIDTAFQHYKDYDYGPFRVSLKNDDTAMGICGLFKRECLDGPDIGFTQLPEFRERGFAYEAAKAVLDYARDELGIAALKAIVSPQNKRSIQLIRKLGLGFETMMTLPGDTAEVALYSIDFHRD